jgi:hypothetical protein
MNVHARLSQQSWFADLPHQQEPATLSSDEPGQQDLCRLLIQRLYRSF